MDYDPIILALTQNRLDHISHQMGWVMVRTARSPIFSQAHDFSCFIAGPNGEVVSQADGIPIHTGSGGFGVRAILRDFGDAMAEGDVYLLNDPWAAGGNHLPDWVIARPVYVGGTFVGLTCNRAHQSDIGGGAAGAYNPSATEVFQEGIRLPVLRLVEAGTMRDDLWRLLMLNTRTPHLLDGDLRAMLGSTRIGMERVSALAEELGVDAALSYFTGVLVGSCRSLRTRRDRGHARRGLPGRGPLRQRLLRDPRRHRARHGDDPGRRTQGRFHRQRSADQGLQELNARQHPFGGLYRARLVPRSRPAA